MAIVTKTDSRGRKRHQVYVNDKVTKKKVYIGTFDTEKDARRAEQEAKYRLRYGEPLKPREQIAFDDLAKRWLKQLHSVKPSTRADYDKALRRLSPMIGLKLVSSLTRRDLDEVMAALTARYAASTVRKTIVILRMVLRMGVDHNHLERLPVGSSRLTLPRSKRKPFEPLTAKQVKKLVSCAPEYWRAFYTFLLTTGARRAEAWGVTVSDLDLDAGLVRIRHQLLKGRLVDLKTDAAYRVVALPQQTVTALRTHLADRPENPLDLVFPTPEGKAVNPPNFYSRVWIPTREKAGLPTLRMHDCRHHVASVYLSQGRSIRYVQRLLGHSQPTTLLSIYAWVTRDEEEVATAEFERWLGEETTATYCVYLTTRIAPSNRKRRAAQALRVVSSPGVTLIAVLLYGPSLLEQSFDEE